MPFSNRLQQMCLMVSRAIEKVVVSKDHPSFSGDETPLTFLTNMSYIEAGNSWSLILACKKAVDIFHSLNPVTTQMTIADVITLYQ